MLPGYTFLTASMEAEARMERLINKCRSALQSSIQVLHSERLQLTESLQQQELMKIYTSCYSRLAVAQIEDGFLLLSVSLRIAEH